jgi:hypothetical protein
MIEGDGPMNHHLQANSVSVEHLAEVTMQCLKDGQFLILPHPEVKQYMENRAGAHDRWIGGMQKLRTQLFSEAGDE